MLLLFDDIYKAEFIYIYYYVHALFAIHEWGWTREQVENIVGEKA